MMWNSTNASDKLCERIIETGLHADIFNNLRWETLSAANLNDKKNSIVKYFVDAHIGALHNIVRKIESAREPFRQCQAVHVLQKFRHVTNQTVFLICFSAIIMQNAALEVAL